MEKAFQDLDDWLTSSEMPNGKKKVLKAAIQLFSKQGYDGTSTAQIAGLSGMSQATIFKYFKSKEDLLFYIIQPIIDHILPVYGQEFAQEIKISDQSLRGLIHFIVNNRYQFLVQNKDAAIILLSQVLINDQVKNMLLNKLSSLKSIFIDNVWKRLLATKEMREDLEMVQLIRLVASQIVFYFLQTQRIETTRDDKQLESNLQAIEDTIIRAISK